MLWIPMSRKRKALMRLVAALAACGVLALLALPRSGAVPEPTQAAAVDPTQLLLSPEPVSSARFATYYAIASAEFARAAI